MPAPAVIAGLVVGAVLGAGLLCSVTYFVHRYMDIQCGKINRWFQHNAVRIGKTEDVESGKNHQRSKHGKEQDNYSATKKQISRRSQPRKTTRKGQDLIGLRGGHRHGHVESDLNQADGRQIQPYVPRPARAYAQPTTHHRALGYNQTGTVYDQLWNPSAIFQQAAPHGTWYAYVPPAPYVAMDYGQPPFSQSYPYNGYVRQSEQQKPYSDAARQAVEESGLHLKAAPECRLNNQPASFGGDSVEVVDDFSFFLERVREEKERNGRRHGRKRKEQQRRRSLRTDLGTCSTSQSSTSTEDIPRDCVPNGASRPADLSSHDCSLYPENTPRIVRAEAGGNPYARQSRRSGDRQEREEDGSVRAGLRRKPNIGRQQAAGSSASKSRMHGGRADSRAISKSGFMGKGSMQDRHAPMDPRWNRSNSKSRGARRPGAAQAPDNKGTSTVPAGPPSCAVHSTRLKSAADGGVLQEAVEEPKSDTATVGRKKKKTESRPKIVVTAPVPDVSPLQSPSRTPDMSLSIAETSRLYGPSTPVSPVDDFMTPAQWDEAGARIGRDRESSISTEASLHRDDRK